MNKIYWCIITFCALIVIFSMGYYISYQSTLTEQNKQMQQNGTMTSKNDPDTIEADGRLKNRVTEQTVLVEEYYNVSDSTYSDKTVTLPKEYVGCTREQLVSLLSEQMKNISQKEKDTGLVSMTLYSFTAEKIVIRKVYDNKSNYEFYIGVKDGYLIVFKQDKTTVFEATDILYADLTDSQKQELDQGVYAANEEELYGMLESYSS